MKRRILRVECTSVNFKILVVLVGNFFFEIFDFFLEPFDFIFVELFDFLSNYYTFSSNYLRD